MTIVNLHIGVQKRNGMVYYFNGSLPFYHHRADDRASTLFQSIFGNHYDLSCGGLLLTLPSLSTCGLLRHISRFEDVSGYYTATQVFISLAFLMLLRVNKLEQTDTVPVGESGRCLGLDRIPEVKT